MYLENKIVFFIQVFLLYGSQVPLQYIQGQYVIKAVKFVSYFGLCEGDLLYTVKVFWNLWSLRVEYLALTRISWFSVRHTRYLCIFSFSS